MLKKLWGIIKNEILEPSVVTSGEIKYINYVSPKDNDAVELWGKRRIALRHMDNWFEKRIEGVNHGLSSNFRRDN